MRPVAGDSSRQATDTIRGFVYQFWHSVHAWLELGADELLFLEGAEDFDLVSADEAVTVQVKATTANLTLRSPGIIGAVKNFWDVRTRNPSRQIQYRFISTSSAGVEREQPFGSNIAGLEIWRRCVGNADETEQIRAFFLKEGSFDGELKKVLETAPAEQLFETLVKPIIWDLGSPDSRAVEHAVELKLINHGDRFGIPPSDSKRVASRLLNEVATLAAARGPRRLDRAQFLEIFEAETRVSVPIGQQNATVRALTKLVNLSLTSETEVLSVSALQSGAPPLPPAFAPRKTLVEDIKGRLERTGFVALQGSTGMGKTILAALVVASETSFVWANLRGISGREIMAVLLQISRSIDGDESVRRIILDDINFSPEQSRIYEHVLAGMLYTIARRRGWILATSQRPLPSTLKPYLGSQSDPTLPIKGLVETEIEELARILGCPSDRAARWSKLIALHTKNHPQLVHARLLTLARAGWPEVREDDLLEVPGDITHEQAQTRMLLAQLPIGEVELLYRLSVIGGSFRRDHAIAVGEIAPTVNLAGDSFNRLVGPWIEPLGNKYFRLSPLLDNAAIAVWSADKVTKLRRAVGEAVLRCGNLTLAEANTILMQGFLSRSGHLLLVVANSLLRLTLPLARHVAESISWVTFIKTEPGVPIFPENAFVNWMLRVLQFHVAVSTKSKSAVAVIDCLDAETTLERMGGGYRLSRFLFLTQALVAIEVAVPPAKLLYLISETAKIQKELVDAGESAVVTSFAKLREGTSNKNFDIPAFLFEFVAARCNGPDFLDNLISALRGANEDMRAQFRSFVDHDFKARFLIDRVWLEEEKQDKPNWEYCIAVFERVTEYGKELGIPKLIDITVRAMVIICDEYLHDQARAHRILERTGSLVHTPSSLFIDEHAHLLTNEGRHLEALELWKTILPKWRFRRGSADTSPIFARRKAAVAAARAGLLSEAADYFVEAARQSDLAKESVLTAGLFADAAFVFWKLGQNKKAVLLFTDVLQRLDQLPNTKDELTSFKLRKIVGQMLNHIRNANAGVVSELSYAPPFGSASDLDAPDRLRELPMTHPDMLWLSLIETEAGLDVPPHAFKLVEEELLQSRLPAVRWFTVETGIRHRIRSAKLNDLPQFAERFSLTYRLTVSQRSSDGSPIEEASDELLATAANNADAALASQVLFCGLVSAVAAGKEISSVVKPWRQSSKGLAIEREIINWIDLVEQIFSLNGDDAASVMRSGSRSFDERTLAALRVASNDEADVESLFYAHVTITAAISEMPVRTIAAAHLTPMVSQQWSSKIAPRGVLESTRSASAIATACNAHLPALQKLARIVLAAHGSITIRLPDSLLGILEDLSKTPRLV